MPEKDTYRRFEIHSSLSLVFTSFTKVILGMVTNKDRIFEWRQLQHISFTRH